MPYAATAVVLGDPGRYGEELAAHKEIELLRARDQKTMNRCLESALVDIVVVCPSHAGQLAQLALPGDVPCLVIAPTAQDAQVLLDRSTGFAVRARDQIHSLVRVLEEITGIRMAREIRIEADLAVGVILDGARFLRRTFDLSKSGLAVRQFPDALPGQAIEVVLGLPSGPLFARARVVRRWHKDGESITGLVFDPLDAPAEFRLQEIVQRLRNGPLAERVPTGDLAQLRAVVLGERTIEAPRWLLDLVDELTPLELTAARGGAAPEWARQGLPLWLEAARVKAQLSA